MIWLSTTSPVFECHVSKGQFVLKTTDILEWKKANIGFPNLSYSIKLSSSLLPLNRCSRVLFSFHIFRKMSFESMIDVTLNIMPYTLTLANNLWYLWPMEKTQLFFQYYINFSCFTLLCYNIIAYNPSNKHIECVIIYILHVNKLKCTVVDKIF